MPEEEKKHSIFLYVLLGSVVITILSSFYFFYYKKDFDFIVETKCNNEEDVCFYRDCTDPDNCPPNGLSYYNIYTLKSNDFKSCLNEDCLEACVTGKINCVKTECTFDDLNNGICVFPEKQINLNQ